MPTMDYWYSPLLIFLLSFNMIMIMLLALKVINNMKNTPKVGQLIVVRGIQCRIVNVLPMGTLDCISLDGKHSFRVSGLMF